MGPLTPLNQGYGSIFSHRLGLLYYIYLEVKIWIRVPVAVIRFWQSFFGHLLTKNLIANSLWYSWYIMSIREKIVNSYISSLPWFWRLLKLCRKVEILLGTIFSCAAFVQFSKDKIYFRIKGSKGWETSTASRQPIW